MAAHGFEEEGRRRVYVVDGARTPFLKAKTGLGPFTGFPYGFGALELLPLDLQVQTARRDAPCKAVPSASTTNRSRTRNAC